MGLALVILVLKALALRSKDGAKKSIYSDLARFWAKIFGINFAGRRRHRHPDGVLVRNELGALLGLLGRRHRHHAGDGRMFAFFAESAFLGLFLFGEKRLGPRWHFFAGFMVFFGSWLSGYFIVATNAFMQHPVGHAVDDRGRLVLVDIAIEFRSKVENPLWRSGFDFVFAFAYTVMAIVLGVALGNVVRGVPLDASGWFQEDLFTNSSRRRTVRPDSARSTSTPP